MKQLTALLILACAFLSACKTTPARSARPDPLELAAQSAPPKWQKNPLRNAYFGDLHVHTSWSPDAFSLGVRTTPEDAYRFARGEAVEVMGRKVQLKSAPYDFLAVTEHSEYLGVFPRLKDPNDPLSKAPAAAQFTSSDPAVQREAFLGLTRMASGEAPPIPEFITPRLS